MTDEAKVGRAVLASLAAQRERQREAAEALREAIARAVIHDPGPERGMATRVLRRLAYPRPSLRTVQRHISALRDYADLSGCRD